MQCLSDTWHIPYSPHLFCSLQITCTCFCFSLFFSISIAIFTKKRKASSLTPKMAGTRRGGRRGARKSVPAHTRVEEYSFRTRFGPTLSSPLRSAIRCVTTPADHSSTSTPVIQRHSSPMPITNSYVADETSSVNYQSPTSSAHNTDLAIIHYSQHNSPHPSSPQYHDFECPTNFSPTNSRCYSNLGSINITEFAQKLREEMEIDPEEEEVESAPEPGFVYVNEHQVKIEYAPLVRDIFEKYGDVTEGSDVKSPAILSFLLQQLCVIYHKLKETKFFDISLIELEKMLAEVGDLEGMKVNVRWLRERIQNIIRAKIDFGKYLDFKEEEKKDEVGIESLENEVSLLQYQLCAAQEKLDAKKVKRDETKKVVADIRERIVDHTTRSLVHGLP